MPTSQHHQLTKIIDIVVQLNPMSVLDIGVGFGKYGLLCREYLELWDGREDYRSFTRRIDGVEVFPEYLTPVHKYVYDEVYIGNALDVVPNKLERTYDLALLIDVLEHFEKKDGEALLRALLARAKNVVVSVPKDIGHQGTTFENEHEAHIGEWTPDELLALGSGFSVADRASHIVFLGTPDAVRRLRPIFSPSPVRRAKRALFEAAEPAKDLVSSVMRRVTGHSH
ncbi:hypothetical protein [Pendulispora albinea]|uniref:Class I SAM-dependent methyltransferase n=1 Tax=Pendulispora albinea TaxID=2741071 RepID=A0ABZ2LLS5_9BACT